MPSGDHLKNGGNIATRFTSERQPENRKKPRMSIVDEVVALMEGDGWMVTDAELLDSEGRPTSQIVKVRFKTPTLKIAARAWASKVASADARLLELYMDRTLGKVAQDFNVGGQQDNPLTLNIENFTDEELRTLIRLSEKATNGE